MAVSPSIQPLASLLGRGHYLKGIAMIVKFEIRTRSEHGSLWGWSYTEARAVKRARKLRKRIRLDIDVLVVRDGRVLFRI